MIDKKLQENELQTNIDLFQNLKVSLDTDELRELVSIFEKANLNDMHKEALSLLVQKDGSNSNDKVEFRKLIFNDYVKNKTVLEDSDIRLIDIVLKYCPVENEKLNILIIKKVVKSLKQRANPNYEKILEYLNYYNSDMLNRKPFNDGDYSDFDLFLIDKMRCFLNLRLYDSAEDFYSELNKEGISKLAMFHIKYNLCKFRYIESYFDEAYELYTELVIFDRRDYLLILPIKYKDEKHKDVVYTNILELLSVGINKDKGFFLKYIYDWIENYDKQLFDDIEQYVEIDENKHIIVKKFYKFMNAITDFYISKIEDIVYEGEIISITKAGFGFIKDNENETYFVHKKYIRNLKLKSKVFFIKELSYNKSKDEKSMVAIVLKEMKRK